MSGYVTEYTLAARFRTDRETAEAVRAAMQLTAVALCGTPTTEQASELFRIGAEAVVRAAQVERENESRAREREAASPTGRAEV